MKNNNLEYRIQNIGLKQKLLNPKFYQLPTSKTVGFTLVELIVVIVILAILWTIAFISFQGYSKNSRDSVRIADINNLEKSLWIFVVKTGFYPIPDNSTEITYLWWTAWIEWTIWDTVIKNIDSVSKKPIDPLTANEYTYSITTSKKEYEIWTISEWIEITQNLTQKTYAATNLNDKRAVVKWTYNQKILKVSTWWQNYILAVPSILATDLSNPTIENIIQEKKLVYNNYNNIPHSYNPTWTTQTWWFNFQTNKLVVYSGATIDFDSNTNKITFLTNLKEAYNWTIIWQQEAYKDITSIDPQTEQDKAVNLVNNYITTNVWWISWKITTVTYKSCTLDWQTIEHNQTITAYSENSILYWASYDCTDRAEERICNNWVLSWEATYQYKTCVKWTPTNCSANSNYTYLTHTYSIPAINHSETATNINSQIVNISNWTQVYKLTSIWCNDWVLVNETEETNPTVTCNSWYSVVWNLCEQNTCATQPTYTHATFTVWTPTQPNQTWQNTNSWNPCYYTCTDGYTWSDCSIAPNPYTSCTWQNTPIPFSATTTYWDWTANECSSPDIIVCSWNWTWYTISACNVWAITASTDWTVSGWQYFQWWRNKGFAYGDATQQSTQIPNASYNPSNDTYWFVWNSNLSSYRYDWIVSQDDNLWWNTTNTSIARQWPCASWYHVPTQTEWSWIVTAWQWWTNWASMQIALKMPYAGNRGRNNGAFNLGGSYGYYWSSSPNGTSVYHLYFSSSNIFPSNIYYRAYGFSVRCFKN